MTDPVSEELERRAHLDLRWRWAVAGALSIHMTAAALILLTPSHGRRALTLPRVQVRITAEPRTGAAAPSKPATAAVPAPASRPPVEAVANKVRGRKTVEPQPRHVIPDKQAARRAEKAAEPPRTSVGEAHAGPGGPGTAVASGTSGVALGVAGGAGEEAFPFTYYLNRVLALIEGNWFRPPSPTGTSCRVRCVIDRSGRLVEAGLEAESQTAAFDRAALRAVYASAPFPPLPQSFGGSTLTLHLEFGP
ncbi:MAG: TonB family protein [Acidobacteriia bacterium]|nr:TonB family protein [Terriglobia bacterium]